MRGGGTQEATGKEGGKEKEREGGCVDALDPVGDGHVHLLGSALWFPRGSGCVRSVLVTKGTGETMH